MMMLLFRNTGNIQIQSKLFYFSILMISDILNFLHLILLFLPVIIYFIPLDWFKNIFKWGFLILILIPIHWVFFDDQCSFTLFTKSFNKEVNKDNTRGFSETYLEWFYKPIVKIIGWEWDDNGIDKVVNLHWGINFFLLWYFLFFVGKHQLI